MRISVLIPSRGRPQMLQEAVASLHHLASGKNEITYVIGADSDDLETVAAIHFLGVAGIQVHRHIAGRFASLGARVNALSLAVPADVYCSLCDDVLCQTQDWDEVIATQWRSEPDGVWWWVTQNDATFAIVSEKWRAAAGRIFTDYFPFWHDDGWLLQLWLYAKGKPGQMLDIRLQDRAPPTHRLRDMAFWTEFYWSLADERKEEAQRIRAALGWPVVEHDPALDMKLRADAAEWLAMVEEKRGDKREPTPEYLAAVERARALMDDRIKQAA